MKPIVNIRCLDQLGYMESWWLWWMHAFWNDQNINVYFQRCLYTLSYSWLILLRFVQTGYISAVRSSSVVEVKPSENSESNISFVAFTRIGL